MCVQVLCMISILRPNLFLNIESHSVNFPQLLAHQKLIYFSKNFVNIGNRQNSYLILFITVFVLQIVGRNLLIEFISMRIFTTLLQSYRVKMEVWILSSEKLNKSPYKIFTCNVLWEYNYLHKRTYYHAVSSAVYIYYSKLYGNSSTCLYGASRMHDDTICHITETWLWRLSSQTCTHWWYTLYIVKICVIYLEQ